MPGMSGSLAWPEDVSVRAGICAYFLIILSLLSTLLSVRVFSVGSFRALGRLRLARQLIIFTLLDSWLFCWASAVILFGVGSGLNAAACEVGIWWCIALYASSKVLIYLFLMERLNVVHSTVKCVDVDSVTWKDRFSSWWYRIAAFLLLGWIGVAIAMCVGRNATLQHDGMCKIGLKIWSTVDAVVNIYLTTSFVWPVFRSGFKKSKGLVRSSCLAATAALITSFANILILAIMKGHQQSWLCLTSCVSDVAANACILYFITRHASAEQLSISGSLRPDPLRRTSLSVVPRPSQVFGAIAQNDVLAGPSRETLYMTGAPHAKSVMFEGIHIQRTEDCVVDVEKTYADTDSDMSASPPAAAVPKEMTRSFGSMSLEERRAVAPFGEMSQAPALHYDQPLFSQDKLHRRKCSV